jgi:mRNA interferase MazF
MQTTSLSFEQGDIVVADILFSEQIGVKKRPVLVISNQKFNQSSDDLIVLKITSADKRTHFDVPLSNADLVHGTMKVDSSIMVDFPVTVQKNLITQTIGRISKEKVAEVKKKIKKLYHL